MSIVDQKLALWILEPVILSLGSILNVWQIHGHADSKTASIKILHASESVSTVVDSSHQRNTWRTLRFLEN